MSQKYQKIKRAISLVLGIAAFVAAASEVTNPQYWYIPFIGMAAVAVIVFWNRNALQNERGMR